MSYRQALKRGLERAASAAARYDEPRAVRLIRRVSRFTVGREYHGSTVQVPIIGDVSPDLFLGHEQQVDAILLSLLDSYDGAFIDVGANAGQTLLKVATTNPGRRYIGFDASIFCAYYVDRLIKLNSFENCTILPIGLADRPQVIDLQYSREADGAATIVENFWSGKNVKPLRQSIYVDRGDTVLSSLEIDALSAIKIDVEGGELEVLSGLRGTLARYRPALVMEILPYSTDDDGTDRTRLAVATRRERIARLEALMAELSYSAHRLMPDGGLLATAEFDAPSYDPRLTNYLLLHADRLTDLSDIGTKYRRRMGVGS